MSRESSRRFEELVGTHARVMAAAIRRVLGRRHRLLAADVEQEVRLALWKHLQSGKEVRHPVSYLYKMALTTALAVVRKHAPAAEVEPAEAADERAAHPGDGLLPAERARLVGELLESLDPDEARALRAWLAGFSHVEVAALYGWSESVARHRIYRTLERLRAEAAKDREAADGRRALGRA